MVIVGRTVELNQRLPVRRSKWVMYKSKRRVPDSNDHLVEAASFIIGSVDFVYDVKGYILCYY